VVRIQMEYQGDLHCTSVHTPPEIDKPHLAFARARVLPQSKTNAPGLENRQAGTLFALIPSRSSFGTENLRQLSR